MTGAFLFLKDIAFIQFTRCGLIAKICHRGNSHQKEMCYDSSIRNKTAAKIMKQKILFQIAKFKKNKWINQ